ncbi:vacuolar aminopeptidase 1 [Sporothrix curviconia]|uniref:Vacuolar aminopeptidase 1 n=1 Tax=Sporothrix curviconia TaxID=1260050 RepID=A0ABP0BAU3_9PEZI
MARRDNSSQMPLRYNMLRPATSYREQLNQRFASGSFGASPFASNTASIDSMPPSPSPPPSSAPSSASSYASSFAAEPTIASTCPSSSSPSTSSFDPADYTRPFLDFISNNPTVFHAVAYFEKQLQAAGFVKLGAREDWGATLALGGKYYVTRNGSSLIAFTVGGQYVPGNGVAMVAGHIDALTARLKPVSSKPAKAGYVQLGVAPYAGALNETWWDRDLAIGGRVVVRNPQTGATRTELVKLHWPIAKISTLAPHFGVSMTGSGNKETQMVPIIGLEGPGKSDKSDKSSPEAALKSSSFVAEQPPKLVALVARELGIAPDAYGSIVNWELELYDCQPGTVLGVDRDLISAGRIDDKVCSWAALTALLQARDTDGAGVIRLAALFDDEEIGSLLRQGAKGNMLPSTVERVVEALATSASSSASSAKPGPGLMGRTYAASYLVSADVTHAVHPNFTGNYLDDHAPQLNVGITVAYDSNGHMTTDTVSTAILQRIAELSGHTLQKFMIRNDSRSGGTIGPSLSSMLGVRAIDAGIPQLGMHSIRATTGALDPGLGVQLFQGVFERFEQVDSEWEQ